MAQNGGGTGWVFDTATNEWVMPAKWRDFLDWLLTLPRDPATYREWARQHDVHEDSLRRWKRDPRFVAVWEAEAAKLNMSVDRVQQVVNSLYNAASNGDTKAASLYLQYVEKFTPTKRVVVKDENLAALSDDRLRELAEESLHGAFPEAIEADGHEITSAGSAA